MTKSEQLIIAFGEIDLKYIEQAEQCFKAAARKRRTKIIALAAVFVLIISAVAAYGTLKKLDYNILPLAPNGGNEPDIEVLGAAGDNLVYAVHHDGLYMYYPETDKSEKLISKLCYDNFFISRDMLYYSNGRTIYSLDYYTRESKEIAAVPDGEIIGLYFFEGKIYVSVYDGGKDTYVLDSKTGKVIESYAYDDSSIDEIKNDTYSKNWYKLRDDKLLNDRFSFYIENDSHDLGCFDTWKNHKDINDHTVLQKDRLRWVVCDTDYVYIGCGDFDVTMVGCYKAVYDKDGTPVKLEAVNTDIFDDASKSVENFQ